LTSSIIEESKSPVGKEKLPGNDQRERTQEERRLTSVCRGRFDQRNGATRRKPISGNFERSQWKKG
jgi:hypothetical protein